MARKPSIAVKPWCPFCGQDIKRAEDPEQRNLIEFPIGNCQCGAVYALDHTGHNVGSAMVDCLVHACGGNSDLAWDLIPDEDYLTNRIENYDTITHQVVEIGNLDGRFIRGVLYFVRLTREIADIANSAAPKPSEKLGQMSPVPMEPIRDPKRKLQKTNKAEVHRLAEAMDIDTLVDLLFDDKRVLRFLQRLLYDPDPAKRWMYAHVLGEVAGRYSTRKPGAISDLLHRLFEACSDSAATHWGLFESIGSIISARPDIYGAFARHLLMFRNVDSATANVLWATAAIAKERPDIIRSTPIYCLFPFLDHPRPEIRGHAVLLFGRIRAKEVESKIRNLLLDPGPLTVYEKGLATETTVGALAAEAIAQINQLNEAK